MHNLLDQKINPVHIPHPSKTKMKFPTSNTRCIVKHLGYALGICGEDAGVGGGGGEEKVAVHCKFLIDENMQCKINISK